MSQPVKKQTFLGGAAVLAAATILVKLIGACYKIPLVRIIGTQGYNYFLNAYDIYSVLLIASTAGLPVAMSRMIAEAQTMGNTARIRRIYQASLYVFLPIGIVGSLGMMLFAQPLARFIESPDSWVAMLALGPAIFFVCLFSSYRGFFQGQSSMTPTAVSQVIEALSKLVLGLGLAWLLVRMGYDITVAAAGAILGVTVGTVLAAVYLGLKHRTAMRALEAERSVGAQEPLGRTMCTLLAIAIPITIGAAGLQLLTVIETKIILGQLVSGAGFNQDAAESLKGLYGSAQTLFNLPSALITPLTVAVIPAISGRLTTGDNLGAKKVGESSLRIMSLIALPCGAGLFVLAEPIMKLIYNYAGAELATGTQLMQYLGLAVIFNAIVLMTNAILQAHGHVAIPMVTLLVGGVIKLVINYFLVRQPEVNIVGAPIGTLICYGLIALMNLIAMAATIRPTPNLLRVIWKPVLATAAMGVSAYMTYDVVSARLSNAISCLAAIAAAGVVYLVFVLVLRIITRDDCDLLPKGETIARLLRVK